VGVIPPVEEDNYEQLTIDTIELLRSYDPSKVQHVDAQEGGAGDNDQDYSNTQDQFFKSIRRGFENTGLKIDTPRKSMTCKIFMYPFGFCFDDIYLAGNVGVTVLVKLLCK